MSSSGFTPRESEEDRKRENQFKQEIEQRFNRVLFKLPDTWFVDYIVGYRQGIVYSTGFAELKIRNHESLAYPTVFIDEEKLKVALHLCRFLGCEITGKNHNFIFFVKFKDACAYAQFSHSFDPGTLKRDFMKTKTGATERWVVHVPVDYFKVF